MFDLKGILDAKGTATRSYETRIREPDCKNMRTVAGKLAVVVEADTVGPGMEVAGLCGSVAGEGRLQGDCRGGR